MREIETMTRTEIASLYQSPASFSGKKVTVCGWVRTIRDSKALGFMELNDGSCFKGVQVVFEDKKIDNFKEIAKLNVGAAVTVNGEFVETPQAKQPFELHACEILVEGPSSPEYPLQKKRHSLEYLRTIAHLRPRANTFSAAFRVRSAAPLASTSFSRRGALFTPIRRFSPAATASAGEMFTATTLDLEDPPRGEDGRIDFSQDFFEKHTSLTVSGQLEAECMAMAFGKVYTFGPTFRAEKSYTQRHAAEFWMIEPEIAFADLNDDMDLARDMMKYVIRYVMDTCPQDLQFFNQFVDKGLIDRLTHIVESDFAHVTYTEAVEILKKHNSQFEYQVDWGVDLQTEHEKYLTEQVFQKPVFVTDYPKEIKSFYMRMNDDGRTVAAMDMLVPGIGRSSAAEREERLDRLTARMKELGLKEADYWWYLDLRRFGTNKHAGFGLGFERLIMYLTGIQNIRDVLPFPRTTGVAEF